jgi:predicted nucleic acid-binding protein
MMKKLIDTNILIGYLRGLPQAVAFLQQTLANSECYVSSITIAEIYAGVRDGREKKTLLAFLQLFSCLDIDNSIAQQGGLYCREYRKSHGVGLADAIIAATAQSISARLITLNTKHFPMIKNIHVPYTNS